MTVSSVKLFFFITFFQRFVSAQFCRLCLSDGSHLLQDALNESLKPKTEHISSCPITQADCHCVCETFWWRATDPTTQTDCHCVCEIFWWRATDPPWKARALLIISELRHRPILLNIGFLSGQSQFASSEICRFLQTAVNKKHYNNQSKSHHRTEPPICSSGSNWS